MSTGFCVREGIWYKWHGHLRACVRHMLQPHPPINYSQYTVFYNGTLMPYKGLTKLRDCMILEQLITDFQGKCQSQKQDTIHARNKLAKNRHTCSEGRS